MIVAGKNAMATMAHCHPVKQSQPVDLNKLGERELFPSICHTDEEA